MTIIPLPASTIWPARDWSNLLWGSVASTRSAQMSASSMAARVRMAENFSMPTSRRPGFLRPAVSKISRVWPLYLTRTRFTSRVVPWRLLTMACCFLARELKRLDLPTFGRPMRAIFKGVSVFFGLSVSSWCERERGENAKSSFRIAFLTSVRPWPVVAEVRKMWVSSMPRARNSLTSRASPWSDLLSSKNTGFLERRADLAMFLS